MPIFEDYHRTIIGYHGTRLETARQIVSRQAEFSPSENDDDWLGHGVYFWEYAPQQAWEWALHRYSGQEIAVLGCMIRLGNCFDLLEPGNATRLVGFHDQMITTLTAAGQKAPTNFNSKKRLDCAVFEYAAGVFAENETEKIDSIRAVYVPTQGKDRLWKHSWLYHKAHVQLCVRNPRCILGTWLLKPVEE